MRALHLLFMCAVVSALSAPACIASAEDAPAASASAIHDGREYLVPELAVDPYGIASGPRPFLRRLSFSPAYGAFGRGRIYALRLAYNPNSWLGYEAGVGHNPGTSVHALVHTLSAVVRRPLAGRFQPYATLGYGMMLVYPGETVNADPVTKNALAFGGGLEVYVRDDAALRFDLRRATVIGGERDGTGTVAYTYDEATVGFSFYRDLRP
jgi:hypothetical protein